MQSVWANRYERLADAFGRGIRYGEPVKESPVPGVDPAQIQQLVHAMQDYSASLARHEAEWQQVSEIEDRGHRAQALGAAAVTKARLLAEVKLMLETALNAAEPEREGG